jgi:hypothetical protein
MPFTRAHASLAFWLCAGCASAEPATGDDPAEPRGTFVVTLVAPMQASPGYTSVLGKVYGGPVPQAIVWTVEEEAGGCRLSTPRVPFCGTACGGSAICVQDDRCAPSPTAQNLGPIHVEGLGSTAFDMEAIGGSYQPAVGVALPYPPCSEGGSVRMTAARSRLGPVSIETRGVLPLAFEQEPMLVAGQPLRLTWTPPGQSELGRIEVSLDVSHHGGSRGRIDCDVPDTGALEIPASQVTRLLALGVAGFPTIVLTRVAAGTTPVRAGSLTLRVLSAVERAVHIEGLQSCTTNGQCPAGKSCGSDLTCR